MPTQTVDHILDVLRTKYGYTPDELDADTDFEEAGFDSLVFVELAVALENSYGVPLTEAEVAGTRSATELAALLDARIAAPRAA
ncbi:acyl carrier protein [Streptacidiphilus monticola]|jgi:acyl carrier protein|uniref:Acyl carrier protein n=1 Tax=Streptacidiphilus monticola TaxID=2161674 RepID=A0ABW1GBG3_9ACTN